MKTILRTTACIFAVMATCATAVKAEITNAKEALDAALKNETIAAAGDKMKLYSMNANYNGDRKTWGFQFYDGGANVHSVYVDKKGKVRYSARDKGSMRIFDDLDFTKLPAPTEVFVADSIKTSIEALKALGFEHKDNGKLYINYYLRSEPRDKDVPLHRWSVTIPVGDGKKGKIVGFQNGKLDTIMNTTIYGG